MKHIRNLSALCFLAILATAFREGDPPPGRVYNLFYVDNSYSKVYKNLGGALIETLDRKVDSVKDDRNSSIGLYLSNGLKPDFAVNNRGAKSIINNLSNVNSVSEPKSYFDRNKILESLADVDLSNIKALNLHFFVTEAGLLNDMVGANGMPGLMFNILPRELQLLTACVEDKISVTIYYPAAATKIKREMLESFLKFSAAHPDFASRIRYQVVPL